MSDEPPDWGPLTEAARDEILNAIGVIGGPNGHDPDLPPEDDATPPGLLPIRERLPRIDWHELWAQEDTEEWIVEPILPARRLIAIFSAPKVGKSLLLLEIAVAVSRGTEVLGTTPDRPRRVLYVDYENDPRGDIRSRLKAMGRTPGQLDGLDYLSFPVIGGLDTIPGGDLLLSAVTEYGSEVVIIDTVSRAVVGEENSNDTWLNFYKYTGVKLKRAEVALIRLDHSGKDVEKGQRGGSAKSGDVDAVWRMEHVAGDVYRLLCQDSRMMITEKTLTLHRESNPLRHRIDADGARAAFNAKVKIVITAADAAGLPDDATNKALGEALRGTGNPTRGEIVAEAVRQRKSRKTGLTWVAPDPDVPDDTHDGWG